LLNNRTTRNKMLSTGFVQIKYPGQTAPRAGSLPIPIGRHGALAKRSIKSIF
jgi:hypothetical protein